MAFCREETKAVAAFVVFSLNTNPRSASGQFVVSYMQLVGPHLKIRFIFPLFSRQRASPCWTLHSSL